MPRACFSASSIIAPAHQKPLLNKGTVVSASWKHVCRGVWNGGMHWVCCCQDAGKESSRGNTQQAPGWDTQRWTSEKRVIPAALLLFRAIQASTSYPGKAGQSAQASETWSLAQVKSPGFIIQGLPLTNCWPQSSYLSASVCTSVQRRSR